MTSLEDPGVSGRVPTIERGLADEGELTPTVAFRILANEQRRFVLYLLAERGGTAPLDELAALVSGYGADSSTEQGLPCVAHRRLYHNHLPRLAEHGLVEYDRDDEAVTLTDRGEQLQPYLAFARERESRDVDGMLERSRRS